MFAVVSVAVVSGIVVAVSDVMSCCELALEFSGSFIVDTIYWGRISSATCVDFFCY